MSINRRMSVKKPTGTKKLFEANLSGLFLSPNTPAVAHGSDLIQEDII